MIISKRQISAILCMTNVGEEIKYVQALYNNKYANKCKLGPVIAIRQLDGDDFH